MRALKRIRNIEAVAGSTIGAYNITYEYDEKERITKQTFTGCIVGETSYEYDQDDNISKEIQIDGNLRITKTYGYNDKGQIISVNATTETI